MTIEVYCDGSGNTFDSDGGFGWRLVIDGVFHSEGSGYLPRATNNVAEISAAIEGLGAVRSYVVALGLQSENVPSVVLVSDSQLTLGYANGSYRCKALHLTPYYIALKKVFKEVNAVTRWVRGHSGDEHNDACDKLAGAARKSKGIKTDEVD